MSAKTFGGALVVAAARSLAAGTGSAQASPPAGSAPALTPGVVMLPGGHGGPLILSWVAQAWRSLLYGAPSAALLENRPAARPASAAETTAPPPVQMAPLSYGGGRGDDPAGPWPVR